MNEQLRKQNQLKGWRDCNAAGLPHRYARPVAVVSAYGSPVPENPSTVQRCERCPVDRLVVRR